MTLTRAMRAALAGLVAAMVWALPAAPSAAEVTAAFVGDECTTSNAGSDGVCTLDEPAGSNTATHGTVGYDRTTTEDSDVIEFTITPADGHELTGYQLCMTVATESSTSPYLPTAPNTCAGASADRVAADEDPPVSAVFEVDLLGAGFPRGANLYFALHVNLFEAANEEARTTYVVGITQPTTRALTLTKDVIGAGAADHATTPFTFTIDCTAALTTANGADAAYGADGNATATLTDGQSADVSGLLPGTSCTVTETPPGEGWTTTNSRGSTDDEGRTVEVALTAANVAVTFFNTPPPASDKVSLTVTNDVLPAGAAAAAAAGDRMAAAAAQPTFSFTVDCSVALGTANNGTATYTGGNATFSLGDDGAITFTGIAKGSTCTVVQADPGPGWTTTASGGSVSNSGRTVVVTLPADATVPFVNKPVVAAVIDVDPAIVVKPVVLGAVTSQAPAQVAGVQAQRLPETGPTELTGPLAALGAALVLAGGLLRMAVRPRRRA